MPIFLAGLMSITLWSFVSWMTFGLPETLVRLVDKWTHHLFSEHVLDLKNGFYYHVSNNSMPTLIFLILISVLFIIYIRTVHLILKSQESNNVFLWVIGVSIVLRVLLWPSIPIHENDFYRYAWDGKSFIHGVNPYKFAPSDVYMYEHQIYNDVYDSHKEMTIKARSWTAADEADIQQLIDVKNNNPVLFDRIGHWQVPTIYPPTTQVVFALIAFIKPDSLIWMKGMFLSFDLLVMFFIVKILKHIRLNPALVIVYGWSPLVLKEYANSAHYDPLVISLMMGALYFLLISKKVTSACLLYGSSLAKFFSFIFIPLWSKRLGLKSLLIATFLGVLAYSPFVLWDQTGVQGVFGGLMVYTEKWSYNASIFTVIQLITQPFSQGRLWIPKTLCAVLIVLWIGFLRLKMGSSDRSLIKASFLAVGGLFLLNPVGDPWYYGWVVPFLCFFPRFSWLLLSGTLLLSYMNFHTDIFLVNQYWFGVSAIKWIVYLPFFVCLAFEQFYHKDVSEGLNN